MKQKIVSIPGCVAVFDGSAIRVHTEGPTWQEVPQLSGKQIQDFSLHAYDDAAILSVLHNDGIVRQIEVGTQMWEVLPSGALG